MAAGACSPGRTAEGPDLPAGTLAATSPFPSATPTELGGTSPAVSSGTASYPADQLRLVLDPTASEARYRVREQLDDIPLPSDAVGATNSVSGMIVVNVDGSVVREE